jgi:hypothetical protein
MEGDGKTCFLKAVSLITHTRRQHTTAIVLLPTQHPLLTAILR